MKMPDHEWALWCIDQEINQRGLPIDVPFVEAACRMVTKHQDRVRRIAQSVPDLDNPGSRNQVLAWIEANGYRLPDLTAATVAQALKDPALPVPVREVLTHRDQLSATSVAKFETIRRATVNGRLKGQFNFHGARTGRWTSRGVQVHNLPRGSLKVASLAIAREALLLEDYELFDLLFGPDITGALSSLIRPTIAAPEGKVLVVADLASIETVLGGWITGCEAILNIFRTGLDAYKDFATHLFHVPYADVTPAMRKRTKPAVLGAIYGLGAEGMRRYAEAFGLTLDLATAREHVDTYRAAYPEVPQFWAEAQKAVRTVVRTGKPYRGGRFEFIKEGDFMYALLPSNRRIAYRYPRMEAVNGREQITYDERSSRIGTHGGKLLENLNQAIARDVLAHGLRRASADPRLEVVGHVHDEIICLADAGDSGALDRLISYMTAPDWCSDAPVRAAGWAGPWYRKED